MKKLNTKEVKILIRLALEEDIGSGDVTTRAIVPSGAKAKGQIIAKEEGVVAGLEIARLIFKMLPGNNRKKETVCFLTKVKDGSKVKKGQVLAEISGPAGSILTAERTVLNFLQRLSGIATLTSRFVNEIKPYRVNIMDTRKTIPGWRALEKDAVKLGGGCNHRKGLYDAVLIKDNHIQMAGRETKDIGDLIETTRKKVSRNMKIEVEVKNLKELKEALRAKPDIIMLDNMNVKRMKKAVETVRTYLSSLPAGRKPILEASGRITLGNVKEVARTGIDTISVGALTHSVKALDISLKIV